MADSNLSLYADRGAFLAHERQLHLAEQVEGHERWDVDLAAGSFTFTFADRTLVCAAELLGSSALNPGSWLWSWANPHIPEGVTKVAREWRELGDEYGIPEFTTGELPLGEPGNEPPHALWYRLTALAGWFAAAHSGYFRAPTGEGTVAPILLYHPDLALPALTMPRLVRVLSEGLTTYAIGDHRAAVAGYATVRTIDLAWDGDTTATFTLPDGSLVVTFDAQGRLANLSGTAGPAA